MLRYERNFNNGSGTGYELERINKEISSFVSPHLHISVAFLIEADDRESLVVKPDENSGVQWISVEDLDKYSNEPHMIKIYNKILSKIQAE